MSVQSKNSDYILWTSVFINNEEYSFLTPADGFTIAYKIKLKKKKKNPDFTFQIYLNVQSSLFGHISDIIPVMCEVPSRSYVLLPWLSYVVFQLNNCDY